MNNWGKRIFLAIALCFFLNGAARAVELAFDDFVPPAKEGKNDASALPVAEPVESNDGILEAKSAQDGLNHALKELLNEDGDGVREIVVPSGFAIIGVSTQGYQTYDNREATLLSKRESYAKAMTVARKHMVGHFEGMMSACERSHSDSLSTVTTGSDAGQANVARSSKESCKESVAGVLAGYVTYYVKDNAPEQKTVTVALASSTATRNAIQKIGGAVVATHDVRKAWDALMTEIASGLMPPMGARLLANPETGEQMVIGFGSSIVRQNREASIARQLQQSSKRVAQMRANNALVSFLNGDKVYWQGGFDETQVEKQEQFQMAPPPQAGEEAPTPEQKAAGIRVFDQTQSQFLNLFKESNDYKVLTEGKLPPGIKQKSFIDEAGDWAISIAVYSASMTDRAASARGENRAAAGRLDEAQRNSQGNAAPPASSRPLQTKGGLNDNADNPQGPSGQVTKDSQL